MRSALFLAGISLLLAACATPAAEETETLGGSQQAIVGGSASPASQDATVLISDRGRALCSGTLIAPNLVLTARHCVSDYDERSDCGTILGQTPATSLTIATGVNADESTVVARGVNLYVPSSNELCSGDIALLSLDKDVSSIAPAKVSFAAATKDGVGTAVGYGGDAPRTTRSDVKIHAVGPSTYTYRTQDGEMIPMDPLVNEIVTTESTCFGDSGGPLLDAQGRIFAVASRGMDIVCRDRAAYWTTLAGHEPLIRDAATAVGHPIVDAPASATSTGGKTAVAGSDALANGDADESASGTTSKKNKNASRPESQLGSAGCTSAPGGGSGGTSALLALSLALATIRRRSRRGRAV
jgi:secreted trypsin-like serine protease